jgi:hypothetical protein
MKAMTWLKASACALVVLAAMAAADTRHMEGKGQAPWDLASRAIALGAANEGCAHEKQGTEKHGCCRKDAEETAKHSGCCRK